MSCRRILFFCTVVLFCSLHSIYPEEKTFRYRQLSVSALLDPEGVLHVSERQEMVFNGDWNGGERAFRVGLAQEFHLEGIDRVVPGGVRPLTEGDLSAVDSYKWINSTTLRWRSRLPNSPPFENTTIIYILRYTLSNILTRHGGEYLLDHDFAFPDRQARIDSFSASLELAPPWKSASPVVQVHAGPLDPGQDYVLRLPLIWAKEGNPRGVLAGAAKPFRYACLATYVALLALIGFCFFRRENSTGRFAPLLPPNEIDEAWINRHILLHPPEVVGAAWDGSVGSNEVAAVLARMQGEKKIQSRIDSGNSDRQTRPVLHLKLLVDRNRLEGYERKLAGMLFFDGDGTDTEAIQLHYFNRGFDPAEAIRPELEKKVKALAGGSSEPPKPSRAITIFLVVCGLVLIGAAGMFRKYELLIAAVPAAAAAVLYSISIVAALFWQKRIARLAASSLGFLVPLALLAAGISWTIIAAPSEMSALLLSGLAALSLGFVQSVLNAAKIRQGRERVQLRKRLASCREYFRRELEKPDPTLQDSWYPYIIAFGLGENADRWFRIHDNHGVDSSPEFGKSGSGYSPGAAATASSARWTGGGGEFGGAGTSGSWSATIATLAAGVPSADSTSSSSGGSSGGGRGGAW